MTSLREWVRHKPDCKVVTVCGECGHDVRDHLREHDMCWHEECPCSAVTVSSVCTCGLAEALAAGEER